MSKQRLVNWTGAMKLSDGIMRQTENFFLGALADDALLSLRDYNYGLLAPAKGETAYNGIKVSEYVTGRIEVQLQSCRAITASGYRIDFDADSVGRMLVKEYSPAEDKTIRNRDVKQWDIILSVDPFKRIPVGEPDPGETPPRHPDAVSSYGLWVMPIGEINTMEAGSHYLTIGRIRKEGERYSVDTQYIPPSASMSAHPDLVDYHHEFATMMGSIEKSCRDIIDKTGGHTNTSELASSVL